MKFSDEFKRTESRFGVFYAPQFNQVVGLRTGLGFEKITIEAPTISSTDAVSDGGFVELAVLLNAGKAVTFDIGGALFGLENDDAEDVIGAEFAIGATFHAGPVDIGLMGRAISLETDLDGGETITEDFSEGRVTIGTSWGYLSRNRPSPALSASPAPPSAEAALITPAAVLKATATSTSPAASAFTPPTQPAPVIERPSNAPPVAVASTTPSEMVAPDLMPLTPAPVAPIQSASLVAGKTVKLVLGAKLRTRPTADATPSPNTPVDLLAVLESSVRNREGVWWYVSFSSGAAWVLEREFDLQVP